MLNKAMIMSAGVGSRLDPITRNVPKPLVPIANIPTMDILLQHLASNGINKVIANTHYLGEQIQKRYKNNSPIQDIEFNYIHEPTLSGTAGGVKKCQFFFEENEDFLVMSADGLTELDIKNVIASHEKSNCIATMVIKEIEHSQVNKFGVVVTDSNGCITEFQEKPTVEEAKSNYINTGIYVFKYEIFNYIPENQVYDFAKNLFPLLLEKNMKINTYTTAKYWSDIGSFNQYKESTNDVLNNVIKIPNLEVHKNASSVYVTGKNTVIADSSKLIGNCVIGDNSIIKNNCLIKNSIIWDNVEIADNVMVKNCIIASGAKINISINDKIIEPDAIIDNKDCITI